MSTTALTAVNEVLKRLRATQATSVTLTTDEYAVLILAFINEAKREVEDAWDWMVLRQTLTVTTAAATNPYTVTGAGDRFRFYDRYKRVWNSTNRTYIQPVPSAWVDEQKWIANINNQYPSYYRWIGQSGADPQIELYATPDAIYTLKVPLVIPDADLAVATDAFKVPSLPIILGAWARAISERGEDQGTQTSEEWQIYRACLAEYISMDGARQADELVWEVV